MKTAKEMAELTAATQKAWDEDGQILSVLNVIEKAAKECKYDVVYTGLNDVTIKKLKLLGYRVRCIRSITSTEHLIEWGVL